MSSENRSLPLFVPDRLSIGMTVAIMATSAVAWLISYELMANPAGMIIDSSALAWTQIGMYQVGWVIGMVAMMFPAMLPIVLFYSNVVTKQETNPRLARLLGTPVFLLGYLGTYAALGVVAYLAVFDIAALASAVQAVGSFAWAVPGLILIVAGVYQLSPMKTRALSQCISPIGFFTMHSQRRGLWGSLRMGLSHGKYCVSCCWAYMFVLAVITAMSIPFMLLFAAIISLEKAVVRGAVWFTRGIAVALLLLGVVSLIFPDLLSSFMMVVPMN